MSRPVVITGLGVLAPNGNTPDSFWESCTNGVSGIAGITAFDTSNFEVKIAGEVKEFSPADYMRKAVSRKLDRFARLAYAATKMALADADFSPENTDPTRVGVILGTGLGGLLFKEEVIRRHIASNNPKVKPDTVPRLCPHSPTSYIARDFGFLGVNFALSTACSSGANAIGQAMWLIRNGVLDACVAGGVDASVTSVSLGAYQALHALSVARNDEPARASRPFDRDRDGFILSEGAGVLILESAELARSRKARPYAELAGYGCTCGAYDMVMPEPDGKDAARTIRMALDDAGTPPSAVDYINAHGTSTVLNDIAETKAIKHVFGNRAKSIPVSSIKSMIGHSIGAAGAIEAVATTMVLKHGIVPPTINLDNPDPECDLDYVPHQSRRTGPICAISNSFGFGSNNAVLVFKSLL